MNNDDITCVAQPSEPSLRRIEISVPVGVIGRTLNEIEQTYSMKAKLPGFRPGRAPRQMIRKRFAKGIQDEARKQLIKAGLEKALTEKDENPISDPVIVEGADATISSGEDYVFVVEYDVTPEFILPTYRDISISIAKSTIDDDDIDRRIEKLLSERVVFEKVDQPAKDGDMVRVSYTSDLADNDDVPDSARFLAATDETWIVLTDKEPLPGIRDALIGSREGDEILFDVTFPDDHSEAYVAGKQVRYKIEVSEVHQANIPKLDDNFARSLGVENVAQLKDQFRTQLTSDLIELNKNLAKSQLFKYLLENTEMSLPPYTLKSEKNENLISTAFYYKQHPEQLPESEEDKKQFVEASHKEAEDRLKLNFIMREIAKLEGISVDPQEVEKEMQAYKDNVSRQPARGRQLQDDELKALIENQLLNSKIISFLVNNAKFNEVPISISGRE